MQFIILIVIGAAAGYIATRTMRLESSLPVTIGIGILGAIVGGVLLQIVFAVVGLLAGVVGAVLGAMLLIWLWRQFGPR